MCPSPQLVGLEWGASQPRWTRGVQIRKRNFVPQSKVGSDKDTHPGLTSSFHTRRVSIPIHTGTHYNSDQALSKVTVREIKLCYILRQIFKKWVSLLSLLNSYAVKTLMKRILQRMKWIHIKTLYETKILWKKSNLSFSYVKKKKKPTDFI